MPFGWVAPKLSLGRSAPGGPPTPAGEPHFSREMGERGPGVSPLDPRFLWPLVPTRWFLGSLSLVRSWGYDYRYPNTDLERIFPEKYAEKAFLGKKVPKSGHVDGPRNSPTTGTMRYPTPKRASVNERAINQGGRGATPRDSLRPGFH